MDILDTCSFESNSKLKFNFNGGDLSSDAGLLLLKEFAAKIGFTKTVAKTFKTTDSAQRRFHSDADNLLQMIYQIIASYFEDDCADELTSDPVFRAIYYQLERYRRIDRTENQLRFLNGRRAGRNRRSGDTYASSVDDIR